MELVGRLQALWRYPVKSRLIEPAPGFEGFVEERWEGGTLLPQEQLPQELEILRATAPA